MSRALLAVEPLLVEWDRCFAEMSIIIFILVVVNIIITLTRTMIMVINQDWSKFEMIWFKGHLEAIPPPSNLSSPETQVGLDILLMGDGDFGHVMQRYL